MSILLDEQTFSNAQKSLESVANRMETLKQEMETKLKNLQAGFNTTAGKKFFEACDNNLLKSMEGQVAVLKHISENLEQARNSYDQVFESYKDLNKMIEK